MQYDWDGQSPPIQGGWKPGSSQPAEPQSANGPLAWWYRLTMPPEPPAAAPFAVRERYRRARMASTILLFAFVLMIGAIPLGLQDPATLYSVIAILVLLVVATAVNRRGQVYVVGLLLVFMMDAAFTFVLLSGPGGRIDIDYLPLYFLLTMSELFAAALLPPVSIFLVAFINSAITTSTLILLPAAPTLRALLLSPNDGYFTEIFRPVALQWIVAGIAFLLVRSAVDAIQRADRAEELAELQRRDVERNRELEEGVRQLLEIHVRLANGDFSVRAQAIRNPLLWQIGNSLNNLIARLSRFAQADFILRRTQEEARRLSEAIFAYSSGRAPIWPAPSNTPLDQVVDALRRNMSGRGQHAQQGQQGQQEQVGMPFSPAQLPPPPPMQPPASMPAYRAPSAPSQPQPSGAALPDWLRPLVSGGEQQQSPAQPAPPAPVPPANGNNPWTLDPEANLPDWLKQPPEDDNSGSY